MAPEQVGIAVPIETSRTGNCPGDIRDARARACSWGVQSSLVVSASDGARSITASAKRFMSSWSLVATILGICYTAATMRITMTTVTTWSAWLLGAAFLIALLVSLGGAFR